MTAVYSPFWLDLDSGSSAYQFVLVNPVERFEVRGGIAGHVFRLFLTQDAVGNRRVQWWPGIIWPAWMGACEPVLQIQPHAVDVICFQTIVPGKVYLGWHAAMLPPDEAVEVETDEPVIVEARAKT